MFVARIARTDLMPRIDPEHYNPRLLSSKATVKRAFPTTTFRGACKRMNSGPFGSALLASAYVSKECGVLFVRPQDCKDLVVNTENDNVYISHDDNDRLKSSRFSSGSLIITKIGNGIGDLALVPSDISVCNISGNAMGATLRSADPYFAVAYLRGKFGQAEIKRSLSGGPKPKIDMDSIGEIIFPLLNQDAQKYLGDKVRRVERLRAWAKRLESGFEAKLQEMFAEAFVDMRTGRRHSTAMKHDISYTLNPGAFDEERLRVQRYLKKFGGRPLQDVATVTGVTTASYQEDSQYVGLDAISSNSCQIRPVTVASAGVIGACRLLSEGPVVAKLRPYLNKVSYIPSWLSGAVGSTELLCIKAKGDLSGWYLYGVLKSEATLKQLRPLAAGATHPRIDRYDLSHIIIPVLPEANELGEMLAQAQAAYFTAGYLTTAAKFLVEAVIEGQITEDQLIEARQALDTGDDSLDREILARLKTDGLDGTGEPLFPDLDQLYDLLERAKPETEA